MSALFNNYLRYIVPNENETNPSRLMTAPYWADWLESFETKSVFCKPASEYNLNKLYDFVLGQAGGAIETLVDVIGVDKFMGNLHSFRKDKMLSPKYERLKNKHSNSSSDAILEFLKERGGIVIK